MSNFNFSQYIKELARNRRDVVFYTNGEEQASILMSTIFKNSKHKIKIYAGCFSGEISNNEEYRNGLEKFLKDKGELEILLHKNKLNELSKIPQIFDVLKYYSIINPDKIKIKVHTLEVVKVNSGNDDSHEVHFTVGDDSIYRVEDDITSFAAYGNFNDKHTAKELTELFDKIFNDPRSKIYNIFTDEVIEDQETEKWSRS